MFCRNGNSNKILRTVMRIWIHLRFCVKCFSVRLSVCLSDWSGYLYVSLSFSLYVYMSLCVCPYIYIYICLLGGCGSLTMSLTGKFVYVAHHLSCCGSIPLTLGLIGMDGGLSTLCHSCGFACQQRVLKTFPGSGYLHSKDGVV